MTQDSILWRYRLEVRQTVPIMAGLLGVLVLLLALGYLYARTQIIATARAQVAQLVGSIARQDDYSRNWLERGMQPLAQLAATFHRLPPPEQKAADARMASIISDERGRQIVDVYLLDEHGGVTLRRYGSRGLLEARPADAGEWTPQTILALQDPIWHVPTVDGARNLMLRYSVPLTDAEESGPRKTGVCSISLALPWFAERVRSFNPFENCTVFFLTEDGTWTLPSRQDAPLAGLKARMLSQASGESAVTWEGRPHVAVYMPLPNGNLHLGLLIPRKDLLGGLDRLTRLFGGVGLAVLVLAAYSLHRTSATLLRPLKPLGRLAARLARGELEAEPGTPAPEPVSRFPDEAQRLRQAAETLRLALHERVQDLALISRTRERLFGELTFARSMQEALRPRRLPPMPDLEVEAFVHTAEAVCGDMYDYFFQGPRRLCCIMGNVAERGVPAALLTGRVIPLLHELLLTGLSPGKALENVNRALGPASSREQRMVSAFVGVLDLADGLFFWACAGQSPPFRKLGREVGQLDWTGNVPLGIRDTERYPERETRLRPGEMLLFAGPRLLSVRNAAGTAYGEQALRRFLAGCNQAPAALLRGLYAELRGHAGGPPRDDLTFFVVRWRGDISPIRPAAIA